MHIIISSMHFELSLVYFGLSDYLDYITDLDLFSVPFQNQVNNSAGIAHRTRQASRRFVTLRV